ncbi:MAG TPA: peptidylprolyl isomerase [Candidatus Limnocylindrales bacterium]|nr:peptidylprolyl isomerase [Candidatus Limnocylindrales bacterium]
MRGARAAAIGLACSFALVACGNDPTPTSAPACPTEPPTSVSAQATLEGAELATVTIGGAVEGELVIELYGDQAPIATASFVALARCGFYDGITFHRVISGFVIQAGDPQTKENRGDFEGLGTGGPGYEFEIEPPAEGLRYDPYVVAMANNSQSNSSQFFIDLVDLDEQLRAVGVYTIFGKVIEGTDVVDEIATVPVNDPRLGLPLTPVIIESISVSAAAQAEESPAE